MHDAIWPLATAGIGLALTTTTITALAAFYGHREGATDAAQLVIESNRRADTETTNHTRHTVAGGAR